MVASKKQPFLNCNYIIELKLNTNFVCHKIKKGDKNDTIIKKRRPV
jgi:hypothetical protein